MKNNQNTYQVAIAGGGPVGLFLGCCLEQAGISCIVFEKRETAITHSRSIGIHPVSLELFDEIGLADVFINEGVKVKEGIAFVNDHHVGTLSFASCPPPYSYILTLPQYRTEEILAGHLQKLNLGILHRNSAVTRIEEKENHVCLEVNQGGHSKKITADYVIGCDGKNSFIRKGASIPFTETAYDDTYIMGDFGDNTQWGTKAAIFLCDDGLIESFPLSKTKRRWVIKTDRYLADINRKHIEKKIIARINHNLSSTENYMLSSFGVQKGLASIMAKRRIILAGDAAHLISPIGGQGMNLGWLDAADLKDCLIKIYRTSADAERILHDYSKRRIKIAKKVIRRAEFNMALGRKTNFSVLKKMILWPLIRKPFSSLMARLFTMRGLHSVPF